MNKEEIKEIVGELLRSGALREAVNDVLDFDCTAQCQRMRREKHYAKKKETSCTEKSDNWPQEGDEFYVITDSGEIVCDNWDMSDILSPAMFNVFKTKEEAEAVRDLRKHEAKCRFTMEDFDDNSGNYWIGTESFNVADGCGLPSVGNILIGDTFPTKELAQERADILKRLAKIRNLI